MLEDSLMDNNAEYAPQVRKMSEFATFALFLSPAQHSACFAALAVAIAFASR